MWGWVRAQTKEGVRILVQNVCQFSCSHLPCDVCLALTACHQPMKCLPAIACLQGPTAHYFSLETVHPELAEALNVHAVPSTQMVVQQVRG